MAEDFNPNETTTLEASKEGVRISSKRMSELVAILSLVLLGVTSAFTWQLYRTVDANTVALRAEFSEIKLRLEQVSAAARYTACLVANEGVDRGCRVTSGAHQ